MFKEVCFWLFTHKTDFLTLKMNDSALENNFFSESTKKNWPNDIGVRTSPQPQQGVQKTGFTLLGGVELTPNKVKKHFLALKIRWKPYLLPLGRTPQSRVPSLLFEF